MVPPLKICDPQVAQSVQKKGSIVVFCGSAHGHIQPLLPIVSQLSSSGLVVIVLTNLKFQDDVESSGAVFVDLFASYRYGSLDPESFPRSVRNVSFAGMYCEDIARDIASYNPKLILYDSFAVIGPAVGTLLDIPYIGVFSGAFGNPETLAEKFPNIKRSSVSKICESAVKVLHDIGLTLATPFSHLHSNSPYLNICCEFPEFLSSEQRDFLNPVQFTSPLLPDIDAGLEPSNLFPSSKDINLRIFIAFGTVVWDSYPRKTLAAIEKIADIFSDIKYTHTVIATGNSELADKLVARSRRRNVSIEGYVDQWHALVKADIFVTHQGLNSTHQAIFNRVPMLSYPFTGSEPQRARYCEEAGLAIPIYDAPLEPIRSERILAALDEVERNQNRYSQKLAMAHNLQTELIAARPLLISEIIRHSGITR